MYISSTKWTGCRESWSSLCCLRSLHGFSEMTENLVNPTHSKGFSELAQAHSLTGPCFNKRNDFGNDFLGRSVLVKATGLLVFSSQNTESVTQPCSEGWSSPECPRLWNTLLRSTIILVAFSTVTIYHRSPRMSSQWDPMSLWHCGCHCRMLSGWEISPQRIAKLPLW